MPINQAQYLDLVDQTGRALHPGVRGRIEAQVPPMLRQLGLSESQWPRQVEATESRYCRAIGMLASLEKLVADWDQQWIRGLSFAKANARNG